MQSHAFIPDENPTRIDHAGFYRRWLSMIDDMDYLQSFVTRVAGTNEEVWVPLWREAGKRYEDEGDRLESEGDIKSARSCFLQARTYYSIGRFPGAISAVKKTISEDCNRAYAKSCAHLTPLVQEVIVEHQGYQIKCHLREPKTAGKHPAVLIMCGADMFKEDRGWAGDFCIENDMVALIMDAPGTGDNLLPWEPSSVSAWMAAIDFLAELPSVNAKSIGAFGISRGGYSVMQLAGHYPKMVKAVVASAGHHFGYQMTDQELLNYVDARSSRSQYKFGPKDGPVTFPGWSVEKENELYKQWALPEQGVLENITMPILMINGKKDHLAPIGNIYYMLEHGPAIGREARIYPDAGHCAFKYFSSWAPDSFKWLKEKLS